jgi:hypothetical protein
MATSFGRFGGHTVSVWLDGLSRPRILACMADGDEMVGIATNPTIFAEAIGAGLGYEAASNSPPSSPLMQLHWN